MSESPPSPVLAGPADGAAQTLSDTAIDRLLADFRAWLVEQPAALLDAPAVAEPALDLAGIIAPFVALRHEVNLQTKASRAQLEQNAQALEQLRTALDGLRRPAAAPEELLRPSLKALIDVHDALTLAQREVQRVRDALPAERSAPPAVEEVRLPFWARWLGLQARVEHALAPLLAWQASGPSCDEIAAARQKVDALVVGYDMSVQRLTRTLEQQGLERIACVGAPFDPECMEVAEVVRDPERLATEVIGELRPGYRWRGKLLRYAQVQVARP